MRPILKLRCCCYLCQNFFEVQIDEGYCEIKDGITTPIDYCDEFKLDERLLPIYEGEDE